MQRPAQPRALVIVAALSLSASTLVYVTASARAETSAAAPISSEASACTLRPSANRSEQHEWASCLAVSATLSAAPALGQTATLTYEVRAAVVRPETKVSVELPDGLVLAEPPSGAMIENGRQSDGTGSATFARTTADLAADGVATWSTVVRATALGLKQIRVIANAPAPWGVDGASDSVFLTVGADGAASRFGGDWPTTGGVTTAPGLPTPREPTGAKKVASPAGEEQPYTDDEPVAGPDGTEDNTCVVGTWSYYDEDGELRPSINYTVQAWDADSETDDDLLDQAVTDWGGGYELCFDGADGEGGPQEVYVLFISSNNTWRVRNTPASDDNYVNQTSTVAVCDGCLHNFGSLIPSNDIHRGMHAFDSANDMWAWLPHDCWDRDGGCRRAVINWTATSTDGTYYSPAGNDVHLEASDPDSPHTVVHELTHSTMDDAFEDDLPPIPSCSPHFIPSESSPGCAWVEGFAEWVPAAVYNDPYYRWPEGSSINLETPTWGSSGWDDGDAVEGRVAGAMIDINDSTNEQYWDRRTESDPGNLWDTFQNYVTDTFYAFWFARAWDGYDVAASGSQASLYQNTIDYQFRDPLSPNVSLGRPAPTPHHYQTNSTSDDWSVVAVRPQTGSNYDLDLYDDLGLGTLLKSSSYSGSAVDFIAVDANHRSTQSDYPRVRTTSGSGTYTIEFAANSGGLPIGTSAISMGGSDVVAVRELSLGSGSTVMIKVVPANGGQDPAAFVMASESGTSSTWIRSRSQAAAGASGQGAGASEQFSYTAPGGDVYGFVLANVAGSGTYTVYADTSAPTGSLAINSGDAKTKRRQVNLIHAAADNQTGVESMRVSVDGTMDSEPWVPFAGSSEVTLPGGDGTKTVRAQYRNFAGQDSAIVSDTIVLDRRPDLKTTKISNPPKSKVRGGTFKIVDTAKNVGTNDAAATISRFYLSLDKQFDGTDIVFADRRDVPQLEHGELSEGTTKVTVKSITPLGTYYVLGCADGTEGISEFNENNNCKASKKRVQIKPAAGVVPGPLE